MRSHPTRRLRRALLAPVVAAGLLLGGAMPAQAATPQPSDTQQSWAVNGTAAALPTRAASQVREIGPGRLDPSFGGFVVTDTDIPEFSLSRQHLAAPLPPHLAERNDLMVFGSGWQAEFLGGMTAFSLEVAGDEVRVIAPNGAAHRYEHTGGNRYRAADGSELTRDADEIIERTGSKQLTFVWRMVAGQWRVTAAGTPDAGMDRVIYDALGRVKRLTRGDASGAYADISYATATTAMATNLGSSRGMIDSIASAAHRNAVPTTVATYLYDSAGRLAVVANPNAGQQSSYAYDDQSRLTKVDSLLLGSWTLRYESNGEVVATKGDSDVSPAQLCSARNYMWGANTCWADPVRHYGWRSPSWKVTPTGKWIVGIYYDHCTTAPDQPDGFDFRPACDMHDYGYGLIATGYAKYAEKESVDDLFYITLKDHTCPAYSAWSRWACEADAWIYRQGVRAGDPNNGK